MTVFRLVLRLLDCGAQVAVVLSSPPPRRDFITEARPSSGWNGNGGLGELSPVLPFVSFRSLEGGKRNHCVHACIRPSS